jgi:ankyrin repeat protein
MTHEQYREQRFAMADGKDIDYTGLTQEYKDELLFYAMDRMKYKYIKSLLENGANPNNKSKFGLLSFLGLAILNKNFGLVKMLLMHGADPNLDYEDFHPVEFASHSNNCKILKLLLEYGGDRSAIADLHEDDITPELAAIIAN